MKELKIEIVKLSEKDIITTSIGYTDCFSSYFYIQKDAGQTSDQAYAKYGFYYNSGRYADHPDADLGFEMAQNVEGFEEAFTNLPAGHYHVNEDGVIGKCGNTTKHTAGIDFLHKFKN